MFDLLKRLTTKLEKQLSFERIKTKIILKNQLICYLLLKISFKIIDSISD